MPKRCARLTPQGLRADARAHRHLADRASAGRSVRGREEGPGGAQRRGLRRRVQCRRSDVRHASSSSRAARCTRSRSARLRQLAATAAGVAARVRRTDVDGASSNWGLPLAARGRTRYPKAPELRQSLRVPVEKLERLAHLAPEMVVQSLKASSGTPSCGASRARSAGCATACVKRGLRPVGRYRSRPAARRIRRSARAVTRRMREFLINFSDDRVRLNLITEELRQNVISS